MPLIGKIAEGSDASSIEIWPLKGQPLFIKIENRKNWINITSRLLFCPLRPTERSTSYIVEIRRAIVMLPNPTVKKANSTTWRRQDRKRSSRDRTAATSAE